VTEGFSLTNSLIQCSRQHSLVNVDLGSEYENSVNKHPSQQEMKILLTNACIIIRK
jgi:hypothetical protein